MGSMPTNSSKKSERHTLALRNTAQEFLKELANLRHEQPAAQRLVNRFGGVFESEIPVDLVRQWAFQGEEEDIVELSEEDILRNYWLVPLRAYVRHLWTKDVRTKVWGTFIILEKFFGLTFRGPEPGPWTESTQWFQGRDLPPESNCERIFRHLSEPTSICKNAECPAPYFFPGRRGQKYCSETCAVPAQRAFKKQWWRKHGMAWRAQCNRKKSRRKLNSDLGIPGMVTL
jgi:hypothetical protein